MKVQSVLHVMGRSGSYNKDLAACAKLLADSR